MIIRATWALIVSVGLMALTGAATGAPESDRSLLYGERLAAECLTCHRRDGKDLGIPGIVAMNEADIVNALMLYKTGARSNKIMISIATALNPEQMQAVARYLSSLGKH